MMSYALVALAVLGGCDKRDSLPMDRDAARKLFDMQRLEAPPGMSDLTIDDRGVLWGIAERQRQILEIDVRKQPVMTIVHELEGIAKGVDTEAILWLGQDKFMLGVEGANGPWAALVTAELRGDMLVATATRELVDSQVGVTLTANHGVEALCGREGELLAAIESVGKNTISGKRWAPVVRLRGDTIHAAKLWLTTATGKISAMSCTMADDGTAQVIAIERHFGVARILRFSIGRSDLEITPTVDLDLHPIIHDDFNLEGIARLPDGRIVMINDNQGRMASGTTELFVFHPR
jgi:hypothetical protein